MSLGQYVGSPVETYIKFSFCKTFNSSRPLGVINREPQWVCFAENIVRWIKGQRISWLGHLERMEEDRMPKNIFTQELEGTRRRGKPRKRWKEDVERDLQVLGVRRWRELVADGKKWKDVVRQAKAHSGL